MDRSINNREIRSKMAKETLEILEQGYYHTEGSQIVIENEIKEAIRASLLYSPDMLEGLNSEIVTKIDRNACTGGPIIEVTDESTLEASARLVLEEKRNKSACLNFASAKNPGGGFLGGSQAQEESLARSSALYPCIAQMNEMYSYNRSLKTCLYSDYMIYSPDVVVFREDRGTLLRQPYCISMITAPAVNAGVVREREPQNADQIIPIMTNRIRSILSVAALQGNSAIVLGAYGCGVFRNDPREVARMFKQVILDEGYGSLFDKIVFAILDKTADKKIFNMFNQQLS
ncbi:TIGR02452 family protein [Paenibacillus sp. 32352]|uniref:TIGR02452 family protein n=1 Tax=Paenibacillus sp. 32352 TaxID=1969111 RepID=UPI0009AC1AD6|nr:TIGR02452 family protein [Paenibacillus sp. 32352]